MLGLVARNRLLSAPLVRYEDQSERGCNASSECSDLGAEYECRVSSRSSSPAREVTRVTDNACAGQPTGYCDRFGMGYLCEPLGANNALVCAQGRGKRFCTKVVKPQTAMILYADTPTRIRQQSTMASFWQGREGSLVLANVAFNPQSPATFAERIKTLFVQGHEAFESAKQQQHLPVTADFGDTAVFLFADASNAALLLQEWSSQLTSLNLEGADRVFWLGPTGLRSPVLIDQLSFSTVRNLYLTDPAAVDARNHAFFSQLFETRWGSKPSDYSGNLFDSVLLAVLANEDAGRVRSLETPTGALGMNDARALKNSLPTVSSGCAKKTLGDSCEALGRVPMTIGLESFHSGIAAVSAGASIRLQGSSGDLELSPAGDRIGEINLWKVEPVSRLGRFFLLETLAPKASGIGLNK